jgi:ATP-binding cassette subfamily E protein 1
LAGYIPAENMRFRDVELTFKVTEQNNDNAELGASKAELDNKTVHHYPSLTKTLGPFKLDVIGGSFRPSEIVMMLG